MTRAAIDLDDTLCDFTKVLIEQWPTDVSTLDSSNLYEMFPNHEAEVRLACESIDFHDELKPVKNAQQGVAHIVEALKWDIWYVSARDPKMAVMTENWLWKHGFPRSMVLCVGREAKVALLEADDPPFDVLIDDDPKYLLPAAVAGVRSVAYSRPWNGEWEGERISAWRNVVNELEDERPEGA